MPVASRRDPRLAAGIVALAAIAVLIGGAFAGMAVEGAADFAAAISAFDAYYARVAVFTLWQALLSTRAFGRTGDHRRPRPVAASGFPGPRAGAAAVRAAAGAAGDRGRARAARALWPCRIFCRLSFVLSGRGLAGHLRLVGHFGRARILQPAAGDAPVAGSAGQRAGRPVAAGEPARHGRGRVVPADRMADIALGPAGRCRSGLHAVRDFLHRRADAGRRAGGDHAGGRDLPVAALRLRPGAGAGADAWANLADRRGGADPVAARRRSRHAIPTLASRRAASSRSPGSRRWAMRRRSWWRRPSWPARSRPSWCRAFPRTCCGLPPRRRCSAPA